MVIKHEKSTRTSRPSEEVELVSSQVQHINEKNIKKLERFSSKTQIKRRGCQNIQIEVFNRNLQVHCAISGGIQAKPSD